jgi:hypothetical protein
MKAFSHRPTVCRCTEAKFDKHGRRKTVWCKKHRCYVTHGNKDR